MQRERLLKSKVGIVLSVELMLCSFGVGSGVPEQECLSREPVCCVRVYSAFGSCSLSDALKAI
jgi:hypothetical protein